MRSQPLKTYLEARALVPAEDKDRPVPRRLTIPLPLPRSLSWLNRFVEYLYRFFPSLRKMPARVGVLERELARS